MVFQSVTAAAVVGIVVVCVRVAEFDFFDRAIERRITFVLCVCGNRRRMRRAPASGADGVICVNLAIRGRGREVSSAIDQEGRTKTPDIISRPASSFLHFDGTGKKK